MMNFKPNFYSECLFRMELTLPEEHQPFSHGFLNMKDIRSPEEVSHRLIKETDFKAFLDDLTFIQKNVGMILVALLTWVSFIIYNSGVRRFFCDLKTMSP